jgi:hypothetical protein
MTIAAKHTGVSRMKSFAQRLWNSPTFTTWGSLASRLLSTIVVLPLILIKFTAPEVVIWQLFATLASLILLLDFGLAPTFTRMLAYARGGTSIADLANMREAKRSAQFGPNLDTLKAVFSTLRWLYARVATILLAVLAIGGTWSLAHPMRAVDNDTQAWIAWGIWMLSCVGSVWGNAFGATLQGINKISVLRRWEILIALMQIATSFVVLMLGGKLLALACSAAFWNLLNVAATRRVLNSNAPELRDAPRAAHPLILKALLPAAWRSGVGQLMSLGIIQASGLIYSHLATPKDAAAYLLALRTMTILMGFSTTPYYSKLPVLSEMYSRGERTDLLAVAQRGMLLSHAVFTAGVVAVLIVIPMWLTQIQASVGFVSDSVWALMGVAYLIERWGGMHMQLYSLTNHIVWHIANGITGAVMLIAAYLLFPHLGVAAMPAAMLMAYSLCYTPYAVFLSQRHYAFNLMHFERKAILLPAFALLTSLALFWLTQPWHAEIRAAGANFH